MPRALLVALLAAIGVLAAMQSATPAHASFHCMRIHAVMGGANGDATIQYVELRMSSAGQSSVSGTVLRFFNSAGTQTGTFTLGSLVAPISSAAGSSILIATSNLQTAAGVTADFTMPANVMAPAGKVQFTGSFNCNFSGSIIDSVAYGGAGYTGTVDCPLGGPAGSPATALPTAGTQALTLNNLTLQCGAGGANNSTEYSLQTATPRNNDGQVGSFGAPPTDSDGDGLTDADETNIYGTDPNNPDTDNDGLEDGAEVNTHFTNPLDPDTDDDLYTDGEEVTIGTLPLVACPATIDPDDEDPDPWPPDFDDTRVINISDLFNVLPPAFGSTELGGPPYTHRADLAPDNVINISDVFKVLPPTFGSSCT